ncbi:23S rRNA (guanosine2251-2'-O)-methyltransferase [Kineococcus radiotolerans]|uniref:RNA methyltransferase, TrmH family, group 3 n=2 Tax=Kineococcus radiotolerans TaxID=131568 RepID=A6W6G1_KINRD|nr:23S rRNA (guanosine(2251)-2'-O)-methyltransferase RlmB [Kineococcus radiotolerans]ABS02400.1 RNA methyltransferase, TrmH family, group 3 [Kineococcus radiotolerans SRS30216 = ATCC BAA-149]MBB2900408.1 23S rRNA (guanosine2251-2'-O)-methyltransferase [Kineococcus radiotolerans]
MAGNSQRRGAVSKGKKGPTVGSGGKNRRSLEGRGPTPKASERPYHPAAKAAAKAAHKAATTNGRPGGRPPARRKPAGETEWIAGRNSIVEALRAELPITGIYVASRIETDERVKEILAAAGDKGIPLLEASRQDLDRHTENAVHQGVAATVPPYDYAHPMDLLDRAADSGRPALVVALDGVTDPRNLGAVVRSVAAFGGHGVVVPERRAAGMTASAWKTSAGAAARTPVARATNLVRAIEEYQKAGLFVVGLDAEGDVLLPQLKLADGPLVLVVGAEGAGLSRLVREKCDQVVSIPMAGAFESLNAGVAAGIALYEVARHR